MKTFHTQMKTKFCNSEVGQQVCRLRWLQATEQFIPLSPVHLRGFLCCSFLMSSLSSLSQGHAHSGVVSFSIRLLGLLKTHTENDNNGCFWQYEKCELQMKCEVQMNLLLYLTRVWTVLFFRYSEYVPVPLVEWRYRYTYNLYLWWSGGGGCCLKRSTGCWWAQRFFGHPLYCDLKNHKGQTITNANFTLSTTASYN